MKTDAQSDADDELVQAFLARVGSGEFKIDKFWLEHAMVGEIRRLKAENVELRAVCLKLDQLDWCIGYELGSPENHTILDEALSMARAVLAKATDIGAPTQ